MIAVRLMGGLGNQMFQYALGRALSIENHKKLLLDLSHLIDQPKNEVPREYELGHLKIKARLSSAPVDKEPPKQFFGKSAEYDLIVEKGFPFKAEILKTKDYSLLEGYWQCEKYFIKHAEQIRKDFRLKEPLQNIKKSILHKIESTEHPVSLHIRRGDYVSHKTSNEFHGLIGPHYYKKAVSQIRNRLKHPTFFIFSDDIQWCKNNLKFNSPTFFVDYTPGIGHQDMMLMSKCSHHIIANSSFSWWGAWLNPSPRKIVIAPSKWFIDESADYRDIVPTSWLKI